MTNNVKVAKPLKMPSHANQSQVTTDTSLNQDTAAAVPAATVTIVVKTEDSNLQERFKSLIDYLHTPSMERALRALLGSDSGRVIIDPKTSGQIPSLDIKPNQPIKLSIPGRNDAQAHKAVGQLLLREAFIKTIIEQAILAVRQRSSSHNGKEILLCLASDYLGQSPGADRRSAVRELATRFFGGAMPAPKKPTKDLNKGRDNTKKLNNPLRQQLSRRIDDLLKELRNDLTQQSIERLTKLVPEYMRKCAEIKVLDEILHPYPKYASQVSAGALRLFAAIRREYTNALFQGKAEDLEAALNLFQEVYGELSNGGFNQPLPPFFKGAQSAFDLDIASLSLAARGKGTGLTQLTNGKFDGPETIDVNAIASDIKKYSEIAQLDKIIRQRFSQKEGLLEERIDFNIDLAPSLPQSLTAVDKKEPGADLMLLSDLLVNAVAMTFDDNPVGTKHFLQIFDLLSDNQDVLDSNDTPKECAYYLGALQLVREIENSGQDAHADILGKHRNFIGAFQIGAVYFCVNLYLTQLQVWNASKKTLSEEDWEVAVNDISRIGGSVDSVLTHLPSNLNKVIVENLLRNGISIIQDRMAELLQISLKEPLDEAQKKLEQSIDESLKEGLVIPLVACAKMLLNKDSLSASWRQAFRADLNDQIKDAVSRYISALEEAYVHDIRIELLSIKTAVGTSLDARQRTPIDNAREALLAAGELFRELKIIEAAFKDDHEIKGEFSSQDTKGEPPEKFESLGEYAAGLRARTKREIKAAFEGRSKSLAGVKLSLQGENSSEAVIVFEAIAEISTV